MCALRKLIDLLLFLYFALIAVLVPVISGQIVLPHTIYPDFLIGFRNWFYNESGDYLIEETPNFLVGIIWLELLFQWPLLLANLYALSTSKPWFNTICLIYGVSLFTMMAAVISELLLSGKASDKLRMMYFPFVGFGLLAMIRGLIPHSHRTETGKRAALGRKKRA